MTGTRAVLLYEGGKVTDVVLQSPEVDRLLVLCEEVMRATPEGARRFVEPAPGVLSRAKAQQHNLIFGRRGSGKSSLLRKVAADLTVDRRPIAYVDMETFKGHSYPDVLISVLLKSLHEFRSWLAGAAVTPANKTSFWQKLFGTKPQRSPLNRASTRALVERLDALIGDLEKQLRRPETANRTIREATSSEISSGKDASIRAGNETAAASGGLHSAQSAFSEAEEHSTYVSHKVEYLHQNILLYQKFFSDLSQVAEGSSFLILDDLYHIRRSDQSKVIDYFHRMAKGNSLWLKIGTIKHRSQWYQHSDPPLGMKLGDDAKEINLDISLEKFTVLKEFLKRILGGLVSEASGTLVINDLMNPNAIDRLIIASGGVVRDFIGIFSNAISQARNRDPDGPRGPRVGAEDVNLATGDYDPIKREEFKVDSNEDRDRLEEAFAKLAEFCTATSKCNVFLVSQKMEGPSRESLDQLIDLRLIHPVKSRVTLKKGAAGELFEAYMLDLSQYTASRKVHEFHLVDLSAASRDESIRRASLIYEG